MATNEERPDDTLPPKVRPGWRSLRSDDGQAGLVHVGSPMAMLPERFEVHWPDADSQYSIVLGYAAGDGGITLRYVISEHLDAAMALDHLRARMGSLHVAKQHGVWAMLGLEAAERVRADGGSREDQLAAMKAAGRVVAETPLAPRKNRVTREHLEEVAAVYRDAVEHGGWPNAAVRQHFEAKTGHEVPRSTVSKWIKKARDAGIEFPPPPTSGSAGGESS